jgi:hypothetical protein
MDRKTFDQLRLYEPFYKYGSYTTPEPYKYSVKVRTDSGFKLIHFGDRRYQHYYDKIGFWSNLNHNDQKRRASYRARHSVTDYKNKNTAAYWSWYKLW